MTDTIEIIEIEDNSSQLNSSRGKMSIQNFGIASVFALGVIALIGYGSYFYISKNFNSFGNQEKEKAKTVRTYASAPQAVGRPVNAEQPKEHMKEHMSKQPMLVQQAAEPEPEKELVLAKPTESTVVDKRFLSQISSHSPVETGSTKNQQHETSYDDNPTELKSNNVKLMKNIDYTLVKGMSIPCTLENSIISEQAGYTSCVINQDVYSSNARILLIEKGSKVNGEYNTKKVKNGDSRLEIIWDRIITPYDVAIKLKGSPSGGRLGESGISGDVDNRWGQRIGSALLISLISDALEIAADNNKSAEIIVESETSETSQKLAEKILDKNINLKPIIYINEGQMINIYVADDIDMSEIYNVRISTTL